MWSKWQWVTRMRSACDTRYHSAGQAGLPWSQGIDDDPDTTWRSQQERTVTEPGDLESPVVVLSGSAHGCLSSMNVTRRAGRYHVEPQVSDPSLDRVAPDRPRR